MTSSVFKTSPSTSTHEVTTGRWSMIIGLIVSLTVEPLLFVDTFAFNLTNTATRAMAFDRVCLNSLDLLQSSSSSSSSASASWASCPESNLTSEQLSLVYSDASRLAFYRELCISLPAIFLIIIYSNLGDSWSFKYIILIGPVASILSSFLCLLVALNPMWPPAVLLFSSAITGLAGGFVTTLSSCLAYLTVIAMSRGRDGGSVQDQTTRRDRRYGTRVLRLAMAEAFMQISRTISAALSGNLLSAVGPTSVYAIGIGLNICEAMYIIMRLNNNIKSRENNEMPSAKHQSTTSELVVTTSSTESVVVEDTNLDTVSGSLSDIHPVLVANSNGEEPKQTVGLMARFRLWLASCCSRKRSCNPVCRRRSKSSQDVSRCTKLLSIIGEFVCDYVHTVTRRRRGNKRLYLIVVLLLTVVESLSLQSACK